MQIYLHVMPNKQFSSIESSSGLAKKAVEKFVLLCVLDYVNFLEIRFRDNEILMMLCRRNVAFC